MRADRSAREVDMASTGRLHEIQVERRVGAPALLRADPDDPFRWAFESRRVLREAVTEHGAVLVRGLGLYEPVMAGDVVRMLADGLMADRERFAPRAAYSDRIYSSTRWPRSGSMCPHHELAYCDSFPALMMFVCLTPPVDGGSTVLVDSSAVLEALPPSLVRRCQRDGWLLIRNYNGEIGPSWAESFGSEDRAWVERYCRAHAIDVEWRPGGRLRTRQRRPAVLRHPVTGVRCWFNDIAFYSEWIFGPAARNDLFDMFGADGLPVTTRFGDGTPIGWDVVSRIRKAYGEHSVRDAWQSGDLLLVDNIRTAHGRDPYTGPREILVGLADPVHAT